MSAMNNAIVYRPINMVATGRKIKAMRILHHITVEQLAEHLGISTQAICKWQRGDALPSIDNLMVLCDIFRVKVEDLIVRDDDGSFVVSGENVCIEDISNRTNTLKTDKESIYSSDKEAA